MSLFKKVITLSQLILTFSIFVNAEEQKQNFVKSFDGFKLETLVEVPSGLKKAEVKKVFVLVHGSGPQNLDEDLSEVTIPPGAKNLFFRDLSKALLEKQFAIVRYNKRSFEVSKKLKNDKNYKNTKEYKTFNKSPLDHIIKDASFFVDYAQREFPDAKVYLLGHSEGTKVSLNVLSTNKNIEGVVLIGFYNESIATAMYEQSVHRYEGLFNKLDKNLDNYLDESELSGVDPISKSLKKQLSVVDLDSDKKISLSEFNAGNYSNLVMSDNYYNSGYFVDEAKLPRSSAIIKESKKKILFLQGEYDNQTPPHFAKSIELVNKTVWKKDNLKFVYFPRAGHALDERSNSEELTYHVPSPEIFGRISSEIFEFFK